MLIFGSDTYTIDAVMEDVADDMMRLSEDDGNNNLE